MWRDSKINLTNYSEYQTRLCQNPIYLDMDVNSTVSIISLSDLTIPSNTTPREHSVARKEARYQPDVYPIATVTLT